MKPPPLVLVVLLAAVAAEAQETYSVGPASAGNVTTLNTVVTALNGDTCARYNLARTCTQAQACAAAGATGGSSCTPAQARAAGVRIYPNTFAGREEFLTHSIVLPKFLELVAQQIQEDRRASCAAWLSLTQTARDNVCTTTLGLAAGCNFGCSGS